MYFWQAIAFLTMFIDHAAQLLPDQLTLFAHSLGRVAFPLFLYGVVQGYKHTHNRMQYLLSLLILALVTEPVYYFYFSRNFNEIFYFLYTLILLAFCDRSAGSALVIALGTYFLPGYFFYSGLMALAMYRLNGFFQFIVVFVVLLVAAFNINELHCIGILYYPIVQQFDRPYFKIPKLVKYSLYPSHLLLFLIVLQIIDLIDSGC